MRFAEFETIETSRLLLRDIRMDDILEYYEQLFGDGDVCRYLLFDPHQDISESMESIEKTLARYEEGCCYRWGIALREEDRLIGVIELLRFDEEAGTCSFAYMLSCDSWNQGYGTEALSAVIRFAFEKMDIDRILVDHMSPNAASGAVMRKAGMTHIGTEPGKYEKHGQIFDAEIYEIRNNTRKAMTVNEYQSMAMKSLNPSLSSRDVLINGVMGLCGEAGEAIDIVKKHLYQGHELDKKKLAGELGDIAWYLAETAHALEIPLEDIFRGNIDKLKRRYPEGFDSQKSIHRG